MTPREGWPICRLTPLGAIVVVAAMIANTRRWADYDLFWHLANGRLMVEAASFPSPDRFSWSMAGQPYLAYSAQADRLFYLLWKAGGAPALGLFAAVALVLALLPFALLIGRLGARPWVEAATLLLIATATGPYWGARPHVLGFVIFGLLVYLVERPFGLARALLAGGLLGLWANLHGTFHIGFGLVGLAVLAWLMARDLRSATAAALAFALGFSGSLLSPYGLRLWIAPFATVANPTLPLVNVDWTSLRPLSPTFAAMGLLLLVAVAVGVWRASDPRAGAALGLVLPAIQIARLTPFAAPLLGLVVLERLVGRLPRLKLDAGSPVLALTASRRATVGVWSLLPVGLLLALPLLPASIEGGAFRELPERAVDRLLACGEPAPVWNDYNWGGYLLWRGDGRYLVGIDGRAETLYSNRVLHSQIRVWQGQEGWEAIVQASPARYALMPSGTIAAIDGLPGWRLVFADDIATLSVRDGAPWRC